jgi:peptidase E
MEPENPLFDDFILSLTGKRHPKVCFVPTASGDSDNYVARFYRNFGGGRCSPSHLPLFNGPRPDLMDVLCSQDVIYVGGGNMAKCGVSRRWTIAAAWRKGVVLCGVSAGELR